MTSQELKEQIMAFAPLLSSIVLLVNTYLSATGKPCIGITDSQITTCVSAVATVVVVILAWWKNNNVTPESQVSQEVLNAMKCGLVSTTDVLDFLSKKITPVIDEAPGFTQEEADRIIEEVDELDNSDPSKDHDNQ